MIHGTVNSTHAADNYRAEMHNCGSAMTVAVSLSIVVTSAYVLAPEGSFVLPLEGLVVVSVGLFGLIICAPAPSKVGIDVAFSGVELKNKKPTLSRYSTSEGPPVF